MISQRWPSHAKLTNLSFAIISFLLENLLNRCAFLRYHVKIEKIVLMSLCDSLCLTLYIFA